MSEAINKCPMHGIQTMKEEKNPLVFNTIENVLKQSDYKSINELVELFRSIQHSKKTKEEIQRTQEGLRSTYESKDIQFICKGFYLSLIRDEKSISGVGLEGKAYLAAESTKYFTFEHRSDNKRRLPKSFNSFFISALCEIGFYYCVAKKLGIPQNKLVGAIKKVVIKTTTISLGLLKKQDDYFSCIDRFNQEPNTKYNLEGMVRDAFYYDEKSNTIITSLLFERSGKSLMGTGYCPILGLNYKAKDDKAKSCYNILFEALEEALDEHDNIK